MLTSAQGIVVPEASTRKEVVPPLPPIDPRRYTLRQRIVLRIIIWAGTWVIRLIGSTLRVSISYEEGAQQTREQRPLVESFWRCGARIFWVFSCRRRICRSVWARKSTRLS